MSAASFPTAGPVILEGSALRDNRLFETEIPRDAILNLIDDFFEAGISVVSLEGRPDLGKTELLRQFCRRHANNAIGIFLKPQSWFVTDPSLLYSEIAAQMSAYTGETVPPQQSADQQSVRRLFFAVDRRFRNKRSFFLYFVLDGIEDVRDGAGALLSSLVGILPLELGSFKFLFTGELSWLPPQLLSSVRYKTYDVPGFTLDETVRYFSSYALDSDSTRELHRSLGNGTPGYLASARRLLDNGMGVRVLLDSLPDVLPNPFDLEWKTTELTSEVLQEMLAILAFDTNGHSVAELAAIVGLDPAVANALLVACSFIAVPSSAADSVSFISASFRMYAAKRLAQRRDRVWLTLAEYFLREKDSGRAIELLPGYLDHADKPQELLSLLDASSFINLTHVSDTFQPLIAKSQLGFDTAVQLKRYGEAIRFGIQAGLVTDVAPIADAKAEMSARLHLGNYEAAIQFAQATPLKGHRLQLLAFVSRFQREHGLTAEPTVLETITNLAEQVPPSELGESLMSTASDLMFAMPSVAINMISANNEERPDDRALDWALFRLSTMASKFSAGNDADADVLADVRSRIKDPDARHMSNAINLLVGETSARDVLKQAKAFDKPGDQIFFLCRWCRLTRDYSAVATVIDHAIYLAIRTTQYTATARDYRDLAAPLPHIQDLAALSSLISAFDIQKDAARKIGPSQDYIQLQLTLAEAETSLSPVRAGQRLADVYYETAQLEDLEVSAVGLAAIVAAVPHIDPINAYDDSKDVKEIVEHELMERVDKLLASTADHYAVTKGLITALAAKRHDLAFLIVQKLNYEVRRDNAMFDVALHLLSGGDDELDIDAVHKCLCAIHDTETAELALEEVMRRLSRVVDPKPSVETTTTVIALIDKSLSIVDPGVACNALSKALVYLTRAALPAALIARTSQSLQKHWAALSEVGRRRTVGYKIVATLADHDRSLAEEFLQQVDADKQTVGDPKGSLVQCARLVIRAFSGLLPQRLDTAQDLNRLLLAIEAVGGLLFRARLLADLALRFVRIKRTDDARVLVQSKLRPVLERLRRESEYDWREALTYTCSALYVLNPMETLALVSDLPQHWRVRALSELIRYRESGVPSGEPFSRGESPYVLDYDACSELLKVCEGGVEDHLIFRCATVVADSVLWKHNKNSYSQTQRITLSDRLRQLAKTRLPSVTGISHDGYKILVEAQALRLEKQKLAEWGPLAERGRLIPNISDRVFVLAYLSKALPGTQGERRSLLLDEAYQAAMCISARRDRVSRIVMLAGTAAEFDKARAKRLLSQATQELKGGTEGPDGDDERRAVVDLAHQIDPELAGKLASELDQDEGRREARLRLGFQTLKDHLRRGDAEAGKEKPKSEDMAQACWDLLGQLNAGRINTQETKSSLALLPPPGEVSFIDSFPVISFVIENAIARRSNSDEAKRFLREVFESTLSTCEVAQAVAARASGQAGPVLRNSNEKMLILAGQRDKALALMAEWLASLPPNRVYICDPYFAPRDLEVVSLIQTSNTKLQVTVVTSRKVQEQAGVTHPYDEFYSQYWKKNFSEQPPPPTEIVVVGTSSGDLPIHDRWMICEQSGLRLGTSLNSLGVGKDAELSPLSAAEATERMDETLSYVHRSRREHTGQRLSYMFFELGEPESSRV